MNFVPCLTWVKRGASKETPEKVKLTKEELKLLIEETRQELGDAVLNDEDEEGTGDKQEVPIPLVEEDDFTKRYNLDNYDDEEEKEVPLANLAHLTVFASNEDDPLMTIKDEGDGSDEDEDYRIKPDDNLIAVGHVESDSSILEIYVYNEEEGHLYVHHDIVLPAFPLAMEWLTHNPAEGDNSGNYLAVGDMTSVIKIWDLDLVDALEPACKLGKKFKKKEKDKTHFGHKDAVLCLAWNQSIRNVLASGSADESVLLWDLTTSRPASTLEHHSEKVQTMDWHPFESSMLLTGSCDGTTYLMDCRTQEGGKRWSFGAEVEKVLWNHFDAFYYLVATEDGTVHCLDVRTTDPLFKISAHHKAVTGMALSPQCPGCLVTVSTDQTLKIWDITNNKADFVIEKKLKLGSLYCLQACPDYPFVMAMGGDKRSDNFKVWDIRQSAAARKRFGDRDLKITTPPEPEELVMEAESATSQMQELGLEEEPPSNGARPKIKTKKKIK